MTVPQRPQQNSVYQLQECAVGCVGVSYSPTRHSGSARSCAIVVSFLSCPASVPRNRIVTRTHLLKMKILLAESHEFSSEALDRLRRRFEVSTADLDRSS